MWMLDWLTTTPAIYLFFAAGLGMALFLFLSLKREIARLEARCEMQHNLISELATSTDTNMKQIEERLRDSEEHCGMLVPPQPTLTGMNLNKRSQAIRMLRLGERPSQIATSLGLPAKEVELLSKVQKLLAEQVL